MDDWANHVHAGPASCLKSAFETPSSVSPSNEGAAEREEGFVDVRGAFGSAARGDGSAAARPGPWTLPPPWTPRNAPTAPWKSRRDLHKRAPPSLLVMTLGTDKRRRACARLGLARYSKPLPLTGFQPFGDTLCSRRRRIHETTIERQDASAIHRLTPRGSCEDNRDGARTREQAHSARLR